MRRFLQPLSLALFLAVAPGAHAAAEPACTTLFEDDAALMKALPDRLRPIVESSHFHALCASRQTIWADFQGALDAGLANPGHSFVGSIDGFQVSMVFKKTKKGELQLFMGVPLKDQVKNAFHFGSKTDDAFRFLDFTAAELDWIAKARASGKLSGLSIIGRDVENARLVDTLATIGFKRDRFPGARCYIFGVAGGVAGFGAGRLYFAQFDNKVVNGSAYDELRKYYRDIAAGSLLGAGGAVALTCFRKTGRNYSIEFNPDELVKTPDKRPPGDIPPIDEPIPAPISAMGIKPGV